VFNFAQISARVPAKSLLLGVPSMPPKCPQRPGEGPGSDNVRPGSRSPERELSGLLPQTHLNLVPASD